jgi:hypothetical protein
MLVESRLLDYCVFVSTLAEVESAVSQLPWAEQEELLRHLADRLRTHRAAPDRASRERWMARLDNLRASIGTGQLSFSSEQLLEDLREDRS